jgi:hypothetical protein
VLAPSVSALAGMTEEDFRAAQLLTELSRDGAK